MSDKLNFIDVEGNFYNLSFLVRVSTGKEHCTLYFADGASVSLQAFEWERIKNILGAVEIISVNPHKFPKQQPEESSEVSSGW